MKYAILFLFLAINASANAPAQSESTTTARAPVYVFTELAVELGVSSAPPPSGQFNYVVGDSGGTYLLTDIVAGITKVLKEVKAIREFACPGGQEFLKNNPGKSYICPKPVFEKEGVRGE